MMIAGLAAAAWFAALSPDPAEAVSAAPQLCAVPVDAVLVLDRSGSMGHTSKCVWLDFDYVKYKFFWVTDYNVSQSWCDAKDSSTYTAYDPTKLVAAKAAAKGFVDKMSPADDRSALVSFATDATVDQTLTADHAATKAKVDALAAGGATNIGGAIARGNEVLAAARETAVKTMILLTDGLANKPNGNGVDENQQDVDYALAQADLAAAQGYRIYTIGLGANGEINEAMLQSIADKTGGKYYHSPVQTDLDAIYSGISQDVCTCAEGETKNCGDTDTGECSYGTQTCQNDAWGECVGAVGPADETCDGLDNDCDSLVDESLGSTPTDCGQGACAANGELICLGGQLFDTCLAGMPAAEVCTGSADEDCDGTADCADSDCTRDPVCTTTGQIFGCKWSDVNANGIWETEELVQLGDWTIVLKQSDQTIATATTNLESPYQGCYQFSGLSAGSYDVSEVWKAGWIQTYPNANSGYKHTVTVNAGTTTAGVDFGNHWLICGDGVKAGDEACDDGNTADGDGCSANCTVEGGGPVPVCGDGVMDPGETCDDGNTADGDTCPSNCQKESSGSGGTTLFPTFNQGSAIPAPAPAPGTSVLGEEGAPVLGITKTANVTEANPGDIVEFTTTVKNSGNLTSFNTILEDNMPAGLAFFGGEKMKSWELGDLAPGESRTQKYAVRVDKSYAGGRITSPATAYSDNHPRVSAQAEIEVRPVKVLALTGFSAREFGGLAALVILFIAAALALRKRQANAGK